MTPSSPNAEQRAIAEVAGITCLRELAAEKTARRAAHVAVRVGAAIDGAIQDLQKRTGVHPVCRPGCDHCCHYVVYVTLPELCAIVDYIEANFDQAARESLRERLERYERIVSPHLGKNLASLRPQCPLLLDGKCSVYAARPFRCRGVASVDASACEKRRRLPQLRVDLPEPPGQLELARAASVGTTNALGRVGVFIDTIDLGRGLAIALSEEDVCQRYMDGAHVLMPALLGVEVGSASPNLADLAPPGVHEELIHHFELLKQDRHSESIAALHTDCAASWFRRLTLPEVYDSEDEIEFERQRFAKTLDAAEGVKWDSTEAYRSLPLLQTFELAYHQRNDRELLSRVGDMIHAKIAAPTAPDLVAPFPDRRKPGPPRIGYIGCNLSNSNGGYWSLGWLKNHPKEFETFALFLGNVPDDVTMQFRSAATHFYQQQGDQLAFARFIRGLDLDLLIYPEIGLAGRNMQYACFRLARTQAAAWGHPITTGLPLMDVYLSSELMEPDDGQSHYRERLVKLPGSGVVYIKKPTPISRMVREDFGLPAGRIVLSCQNPIKYAPRWDPFYAELSERVGTPIVFLEGVGRKVQRLKRRMEKAGVRARWVPTLRAPEFLALIRLADVCVDAPGWNGGNTTIHCMDLGSPVVSLVGDTMRGRHGLGFLTVAKATGMLAYRAEDYFGLATNQDRLEALMSRSAPGLLFGNAEPINALNTFARNCAA